MSLRSKFLSVLSLTFAVAMFATFSFAQDSAPTNPAPNKAEKRFKGERGAAAHRGGGRHGKRGGKGELLRGLNLSDAQKAQIKSLRENNKPDEATRAEIRTIREAHKNGDAITPEQQARVKEIREQGRTKAKAAREQIMVILTPEQKAQIETRKSEMRQRLQQQRTERKNRVLPAATDKPVTK